ncbi:hypothetical protein [Agromyces sp. H66]|uniref:hypothetical protein n=1 Tax=Agromyces sp. H66 TaxID=2529859 RepID=UPI0020BDD6E5|nr:hypothetical protein [Agromyces sp. H66]
MVLEHGRLDAVPEQRECRDDEMHRRAHRAEVAGIGRPQRIDAADEQRDRRVGLALRPAARIARRSYGDGARHSRPDRDRLLRSAQEVDPGHAVVGRLDDEPPVVERPTLAGFGGRGLVPVLHAHERPAEPDRRHAARLLDRLLLELGRTLAGHEPDRVDERTHVVQRHVADGERLGRRRQIDECRGVMHQGRRCPLMDLQRRGELGRTGAVGPLPVLAFGARRVRLDRTHQQPELVHPAQLFSLQGADGTLELEDAVERLDESGCGFHAFIRPRPADIRNHA